VQRALERLEANRADPALHLHKLSSHLAGYWAISAAYDLRVVCQLTGDTAYPVTVGSHDEVY
jgi:mRNA-degrading endonuclease YafQ of YafQ-DinJ toxin-antitoxin module